MHCLIFVVEQASTIQQKLLQWLVYYITTFIRPLYRPITEKQVYVHGG